MTSEMEDPLFARSPSGLLYHYTGYEAVLNIVRTNELWATEIRYLNDSSELRYATQLLAGATHALESADPTLAPAADQFRAWLELRLPAGHMLFAVCFSEDGNLLSQWRGYTPHGKGVSLGFEPKYIEHRANILGFRLGQCIYDVAEQDRVTNECVEKVLTYARNVGPCSPHEAHPTQSFHPRFTEYEEALLKVSALIKHPAFKEEREWRAISPIQPSYVDHPPSYRAGRMTLIPYKPFGLSSPGSRMQLSQVFLGPTPQNNLAMNALSTFLSSSGVSPKMGPFASQLPYREM